MVSNFFLICASTLKTVTCQNCLPMRGFFLQQFGGFFRHILRLFLWCNAATPVQFFTWICVHDPTSHPFRWRPFTLTIKPFWSPIKPSSEKLYQGLHCPGQLWLLDSTEAKLVLSQPALSLGQHWVKACTVAASSDARTALSQSLYCPGQLWLSDSAESRLALSPTVRNKHFLVDKSC